MFSFSAFVRPCKDGLNSSGNYFFRNEHLNSASSLERVGGCPHKPFEFLTKATRVSGRWFVPTSALPLSALPFCPSSESALRFFCVFFSFPGFFFPTRPIPVESSMSATPSLQSSCSGECVFLGLGDRVQHSSFCDFCILVIC